MKLSSITLALMALAFTCVADLAVATPHCEQCPYDCDDLGLGDKDCSFISESNGICCLDLTQKGLEIAAAQDEAEGEEEDDEEECPAGFEESEDKCTPEEREEGCKDIRLPNGTGCVNR